MPPMRFCTENSPTNAKRPSNAAGHAAAAVIVIAMRCVNHKDEHANRYSTENDQNEHGQ